MDGFAAAWIVRKVLGDGVEFVGGVYDQQPPEIEPESTVYIVDFSYPRDVLLAMTEGSEVVVLDHHKSAQANLAGLPFAQFDMNRSGAMMTWDYFCQGKRPPEIIDYIQDRDLWRFELPQSKEVNAALFSYPMEFPTFDILAGIPAHILAGEGVTLLRQRQKHIDSFVRGWSVSEVEIGGYTVPCLNCPRFLASEVLHTLAKGYPFAASYFDSADNRSFELRSADDGVDVSEIARLYGGGGHQHAAGFTVKKPKVL